eukprot:3225141-Prymnesium_polylepis.1
MDVYCRPAGRALSGSMHGLLKAPTLGEGADGEPVSVRYGGNMCKNVGFCTGLGPKVPRGFGRKQTCFAQLLCSC